LQHKLGSVKKMKHIILIFSIFLVSCQTTKVFYNDLSGVDGGEIWGSALHYFFDENEYGDDILKKDEIKAFNIKSNKLYTKLKKIKKQIIEENSNIVYEENGIFTYGEEHIYNCAFITQNNDTLYGLGWWRYKNLVTKYKKSDVTMIFNVKNQELNNQLQTIKNILNDSGYTETRERQHYKNIFIMPNNDTISVSYVDFYLWKYKDKWAYITVPDNLIYFILKNRILYDVIAKNKKTVVKKVRQKERFEFDKNEIIKF